MARLVGLSLLGLVLFASILIPTSTFAGGDFGKIPDSVWSLGAPLDFKDANALILFDRCTVTVSPNSIDIIRHCRMKALSKAGAEAIGTVEITHHEKDKIKDLQALTVTPSGSKIELNKKTIGVKTTGAWRITTFAFPQVDSGCVVEFRYRNVNERFYLLDSWHFSNDHYTLESQMTLVLYPGFTYSTGYSYMSIAEAAGKESSMPNPENLHLSLKAFTWTKRNLLPVVDEPYMGAAANFKATLFCQLVSYVSEYDNVTFIRNWSDLGNDMQGDFDEYTRGGDPKTSAAEIVGDALTQQEKARRLYQYVATNINTTENVIGRYFNNKSSGELVKARSGTAEEKNMWLTELCRAAGLKAWPVMIATRGSRKFNPEVFQLNQFNHVITYVEFDSGHVFMDATSRHCPYGILPADSRADLGFLIDGKKSEVIRIVVPEVRSYRFDATSVAIDEDGLARCSTVCQFTGLYGAQFGRYFEEGKPEDIVKEDFVDKLDEGATIDTFSYEQDSTGNFRVTIVYDAPNLARSLDSLLIVKFSAFSFRDNPFTASRRQFPIDFDFPRTIHTQMQIRTARPSIVAALPPSAKEEIDGAVFTCLSQLKDSVVTVESKIRLTKALYAPAEYNQIKTFFDAVARSQQEEVKLTW